MEKQDKLFKDMERLGVIALEADGELNKGGVKAILEQIEGLEKAIDFEDRSREIAKAEEEKQQSALEIIDYYNQKKVPDAR